MDTGPPSPATSAIEPPRTPKPEDAGDDPKASQASQDAPEATEPPTEAPTGTDTPVAGPSAAPKRSRKSKAHTQKQTIPADGFIAYTTAYVPGLYNVKNPAGDFSSRESNVGVIRQLSQARARREREEEELRVKLAEEAAATEAEAAGEGAAGENGDGNEEEPKEANGTTATTATSAKEEKKEPATAENPLSKILIIHPGSRNLRLGRASDFYPHEVPNCIARPASAPGGFDPPAPGKRSADEAFDANIGYLRDYLRNRLRQNKLTTDWKEGQRVNNANAKAKPESIPEHNDPRRIEWTELEGRPYVVGADALKLPTSKGWRVRYPIIQRKFNTRDWKSHQLLLDDFTIILQESLRTELGIKPIDYKNYSVVLIVPDHGDRAYIEQMTNILFTIMGFKQIAIHQESYCAVFSAGMSSACVVDIGAQETSVTCVDEGVVNPDTRITLNYGGDDVTIALKALLERSSFPYRDLDLSRAQDWIMLDELKMRICTLEEHLVANTPWEFYVLSEGLTQKYLLRTYDENVLAPLCFFDTRMIDFETKKEDGKLGLRNLDVDDLIKSHYDEPTGAMKACTGHLLPSVDRAGTPAPGGDVTPVGTPGPTSQPGASATSTPAPPAANTHSASTPIPNLVPPTANPSAAATPGPDGEAADDLSLKERIAYEASKTPLDGAIAASIAQSASENKIKTAANSILLVGGSSALKGLVPFISERLPSLLRQRGLPIQDVTIVPPPRNLNPKFVSWKGASVMCNLDSLSDMWIRKDEFEAIGARTLKDHLLFL